MPERILGLDMGGGSVKAVLLSRGLRGGYRMLGFTRIDAPAGDLQEALESLFSDPAFRNARCVTALPAGTLSFRNVRLPFRDDRKIRNTLAFALEPLVQKPLNTLFVDYILTGQAPQAEIFAALAPRALVEQRIAHLAGYVRDVAVIDIDAVPLALRLMENPGFAESGLLVDIGARDTTALFAAEGRIRHIRHIPFGGQTVTEAVARTLGIDTTEAEKIKLGGDLPREAMSAITAEGNRFSEELKNTQAYLLWQGRIPQAPSRIILTGGGSRTPGLAERIGEVFDLSVRRTDLAALRDVQIADSLRRSWDPALMDQALALAARPMTKGSGFNFRQRASEAHSGRSQLRVRLKKAAVAALVILGLLALETGIDDYGDRLRLAALKREVGAAYKRMDPDAQRIVDPVAQIRGKIAEARKQGAGTGDAATAATVLDLLREISGLAPADLLLTAFHLDGNVIDLKGEVRNADSVDALKAAFANSQTFRTAVTGATSTARPGGGFEFDLRMTLKK
ncbi:MAG: cell division FtsA domain-containing protein [Thermodesulfobacteriota bacterium]